MTGQNTNSVPLFFGAHPRPDADSTFLIPFQLGASNLTVTVSEVGSFPFLRARDATARGSSSEKPKPHKPMGRRNDVTSRRNIAVKLRCTA
ncbi:hypothetical protein QC761_0049910 [Podospora bellae-mahoneyi]|uniref:Uncharacterized protein n=1 Tax=Podospora bellae-mahoneyi TaxID=2093777 RepID=A0ABR0FMN6_9PEZI|nr:hypothetical protein QC761_0049910 [Podospora bellae-mahoneyi]